MKNKKLSYLTTAFFLSALALSLWAITSLADENHSPVPPEHQAWQSAGDAPVIYWALVVLVGGGLLTFIFWALYGKMRPGKLSSSNFSYHALGALVLFMTLFTLALYLVPANQAKTITPTARAWDFSSGEKIKDPGGSNIEGEPYRGYLIYLANGCQYCHTLYLRTEDIKTGWGEGARPDEVSQIGDYVYYPFTMLGTQRDGPDLTVIGRKIPDMQYQKEHLIDPRKFKPKSIMPTYRYLSDQDLNDLAAYLVTLGNDPKKLREGATLTPPPTTESPLIAKGKELYRSLGCVGCHTVNGTPNAGPTWQGLFEHEMEVTLPDGSTIKATADEAYIKESILSPAAKIVKGFANIMPPQPVSEEEVQALIEYIKSLTGEHK
jgi:cbb3-type cytochrome oxidase cytochrome c subunit